MQDETAVKIFRSFSLPLVTFEYLKKFQRDYQAKHNVVINNNQTLAVLLAEHKQLNVENEEYANKSNTRQ